MSSLSRLNQREQRMVWLGGIAAAVLLVIAVVLPLQRSVTAGARRIERKRGDLVWLRAMGPQLGGALPGHTAAPLHESLVVLVDRTARDAGIGKSLVGSQPSGDGGLNVRFEEAPFDAMVAWLSQLSERYGVRADSATIDVAKTAGTVNATLVLHER
ncbi:MAG TPA: type II secretion system protein M [Steroidobacteraceae bacterium]|nr:type II secretion system protein M [Steroidobacteraceae bacterium]